MHFNRLQLPHPQTRRAVKDTSGNAIETKRLDWTYTGKDGKEYQATEYIRAFSTIKKPTMLTATFICPKDKYSTAVLDDLMKDTTVTDPGPADMDEGTSDDGASKDSKRDDKKSDEKGSGSSPKDT